MCPLMIKHFNKWDECIWDSGRDLVLIAPMRKRLCLKVVIVLVVRTLDVAGVCVLPCMWGAAFGVV